MKAHLLEFYITEAIAKSRIKPHRKVSAVLAEAMPEVCTELRRMVTAPDSDIPTKKFAIAMIENLWRTLLSTAQSETRTAVKREHVKVRAKRVKVAETQTGLQIAAERRRIDGVLEQAEKELGGA
jgi:hypothetical protein